LNYQIGDIISIDGNLVKIGTRKPFKNISKFQLYEYISRDDFDGFNLLKNDMKKQEEEI
jgi:hypothetical protein